MARRSNSQADLATKQAINLRWRYLLRNPTFRSELATVSDLAFQLDRRRAGHRKPKTVERFNQQFEALLRKWGFSYINLELLLIYHHLRHKLPHEVVAEFDTAHSYVLSFPVLETREDDDFLRLQIDLRHPLDVLMAHVEKELQEAIGDEQRQRRRLDKAELYIAIYDRAVQGESFASIAKTLRQRVSTVKSAYAAAMRNIYGGSGAPKKRNLPLATFEQGRFDPEIHFATCSACKKAQTAEEMCPVLRAYAMQDSKSLKEYPVTGS